MMCQIGGVGQFTGVIQICPRLTPVAMVPKSFVGLFEYNLGLKEFG